MPLSLSTTPPPSPPLVLKVQPTPKFNISVVSKSCFPLPKVKLWVETVKFNITVVGVKNGSHGGNVKIGGLG